MNKAVDKLKKSLLQTSTDNRFSDADESVGKLGPSAKKTTPKTKPKAKVRLVDQKGDELDDQPVMVRDGFTMPVWDYELIEDTRVRLAGQGIMKNKTEILRMALNVLNQRTDKQLVDLAHKVPKIKTGRPGTK